MSEARTILIVDNDPSVRSSLEKLLKQEGYGVMCVGNGNDVLGVLNSHNVALVLLDIMNPVKDGVETLIALKRQRPDLPVLAMSGGRRRGTHDFLNLATKFGADGTVRKSSGMASIVERVQQHV